jgi:hypothetical protein
MIRDRVIRCAQIGALLAVVLIPAGAAIAAAHDGWSSDVRLGGSGGLYLLAEPGELWVEIEKADRNVLGRSTHLRAILFGPDRRVLDEQWIADDGREKGSGTGPVQRVRLATTVAHAGVYGVNITVTEDRYGEDYLWGFRTNCPKYLVETSRGHRDAPHEEPLVLANPDAAGEVVFMPRMGEFTIDVTGLPAEVETLTLAHRDGVDALPVAEGAASGTFAARSLPRRPWRLHLPAFQAQVHIDGVTRWDSTDVRGDLSLWTPHAESWFPFHAFRWLITPYGRVVYAESGEGTMSFEIHNNDWEERDITLRLEFPDGPWPARLALTELTINPNQSRQVHLNYRVPDEGEAWTCHVRATPASREAFSTYATFELRRGIAPAAEPIAMPLVLKPYQHENEQFGYAPEYPLDNQVYFDLHNRPAIAAKKRVFVQRDGVWQAIRETDERNNIRHPFDLRHSKIAFDHDNGLYAIGSSGRRPLLLHLPDSADVFTAHEMPPGGVFDIEQFSGHNGSSGIPPLVRYTLTARDPNVFWRRVNDLHLFVPERTQSLLPGRQFDIDFGEPILLSNTCIGASMHSGIPSSIVSRGDKVHVVWAEATEPEENVPGVPTFVATYDRVTRLLSAPALVGYGPPANDVHNTPCITMDSEGYLHVLVGTHGRTFRYARSLAPNEAGGGWTEAEELGPGLRQTYVGLVCDRNDTLHVVFRLWHTDTTYFPAGHYATLSYMSKPAGGKWSEPRPLIVSPFSEYSVFYHRLTIDREGALYLSYDYWSTFWFYRTDHRGTRRALLTSPDGATWRLATLPPR